MDVLKRKQALDEGLKHYFTGKPCKRGHVDKRLVSTRQCFSCVRDHSKAWARDNVEKNRKSASEWARQNPDKKKQTYKAWAENNIDRRRDYNRVWKEANKDHVKEYYAKKRKENPLQFLAKGATRRARKRGAEGVFTKSDLKKLKMQQRNKCAYCKKCLEKHGQHIDHVIPLVKGGSNKPENIQLLCPNCNLRKRDKDPIDFQQERGFLL